MMNRTVRPSVAYGRSAATAWRARMAAMPGPWPSAESEIRLGLGMSRRQLTARYRQVRRLRARRPGEAKAAAAGEGWAAMAEETQFTLGAKAHCSDGSCGEVRRLVIDPAAD